MKFRLLLTASAFVLVLAATSTPASAAKKFENLKVLKDNGKDLEKGMKNMSKGLGVKCTACHVKGDFASDEVKAKDATRKFFTATVGKKDGRDAALKELLGVLKVDKLKKADKFWAGVDKLAKK
ncbi:MAG: hypothetical protein RL846_01600 [Deltaproteobacteria bacterium]